jgi:hypothetical protein
MWEEMAGDKAEESGIMGRLGKTSGELTRVLKMCLAVKTDIASGRNCLEVK